MTDPIRADLERLHQYAEIFPEHDTDLIVARALAALSADGPAVPEGREPASVVGEPSDAELLGLDQLEAAWNAQADAANSWDELSRVFRVTVWAQRQALARWGHHPVPPAEGEVGELVAWLTMLRDHDLRHVAAYAHPTIADHWNDFLTRAADLLAQRHPAPVPVTERLPGPEDCTTNPRNGQGQWCWGWVQHDPIPYSGRWRMMRRQWLADEAVAWLPAHALPLPAGEVEP